MKIQQFINDFTNELDDDLTTNLSPDTNFRELDSWDSLSLMSVLAMFDDKYNVIVNAGDISSTNTLQELFELIEDKMRV